MRFDIAIADPDWWYNKRLNEQHGGNRTKFGDGVWNKYRTPPSRLETIKSMPIKDIMKDDSLMFLWTTGPHLMDAGEVLKAWGFRYITIAFVMIKISKSFVRDCVEDLVWLGRELLKGYNIYEILIRGSRKMPGNWTASNVEIVLLGKRGKFRRSTEVKMFPQLIFVTKPPRPHQKPDRVHGYIDRSWPESRCVEFYARKRWNEIQAGGRVWICLGNEVPGQEGVDMRISIRDVLNDEGEQYSL